MGLGLGQDRGERRVRSLAVSGDSVASSCRRRW